MTIRPQDTGRPAIVGVIGRTLVDGRAVQVELYAPEEEAPIPELIALGHDSMAALWEANAATAGSGTVTMDSYLQADEAESSDATEESEAEEDGTLSDEAPLSEEEELAAAFDMLTTQMGEAVQTLYWIVLGYLGASILLGVGIWASFKLRRQPA
jgi:hypothetical protein